MTCVRLCVTKRSLRSNYPDIFVAYELCAVSINLWTRLSLGIHRTRLPNVFTVITETRVWIINTVPSSIWLSMFCCSYCAAACVRFVVGTKVLHSKLFIPCCPPRGGEEASVCQCEDCRVGWCSRRHTVSNVWPQLSCDANCTTSSPRTVILIISCKWIPYWRMTLACLKTHRICTQ